MEPDGAGVEARGRNRLANAHRLNFTIPVREVRPRKGMFMLKRFLIGLVLFNIGVGPVRGFAVTLMVGIVTLAAAVAGIALSGRENGAVRYLGYAVFAIETLYLASETIGSIIGTSGFFLVAGLVVALIAWAVIAMERRLSRTGAEA